MKRFIIAFALLAIALPARAEIVTKDVEYLSGKTTLKGTLIYDEAISSLRPGVILYPEWWGHNDYIKKRARQMAEAGYVAFAADMYGVGKVTTDPKEAKLWSDPLYKDRNLMRERARSALNLMKQQVNVDKSKIAVLGFCFGGVVGLELARAGDDFAGLAAFHTGLEFPGRIDKAGIKPKILIMNGAADPMVTMMQKNKFITDMEAAKADYQFIQYSGAEHAFTNPDADKAKIKGVSYNAKAEKRSFEQLELFLTEVFGKRATANAEIPEKLPAKAPVAQVPAVPEIVTKAPPLKSEPAAIDQDAPPVK